VFVFTVGSGADVIVDFNGRFDALDLTGQTVVSYGSVGGDALINFEDGGSVRLMGVSLDTYLSL